jgi:hypothetical protein
MLLGLMTTLVALLAWLDGRIEVELEVAKVQVASLPHASWCDPLL